MFIDTDPLVWLILLGAALLVASVIAIGGRLILGFSSARRLWTFIVTFVLMNSVNGALVAAASDRDSMVASHLMPALFVSAYFLPTMMALVKECELFRGIFLMNLLFGWTVVGWVVAVMLVFHPSEAAPDHQPYRLTPFGAVPRVR